MWNQIKFICRKNLLPIYNLCVCNEEVWWKLSICYVAPVRFQTIDLIYEDVRIDINSSCSLNFVNRTTTLLDGRAWSLAISWKKKHPREKHSKSFMEMINIKDIYCKLVSEQMEGPVFEMLTTGLSGCPNALLPWPLDWIKHKQEFIHSFTHTPHVYEYHAKRLWHWCYSINNTFVNDA